MWQQLCTVYVIFMYLSVCLRVCLHTAVCVYVSVCVCLSVCLLRCVRCSQILSMVNSSACNCQSAGGTVVSHEDEDEDDGDEDDDNDDFCVIEAVLSTCIYLVHYI